MNPIDRIKIDHQALPQQRVAKWVVRVTFLGIKVTKWDVG